MRAIVAVFLIGCTADAGGFPSGMPGGGGPVGGGGNRVDAGVALVDAQGSITGSLCAVNSVEVTSPCTPLPDSGLSVTVSETGAHAAVGDDGRFVVPGAAGKTQVTLVSSSDRTFFGSAVVAILGAGGSAVATIPVLRQTVITDLAMASGVAVAPGFGVLVVHTASGATLDTIGGALPYYDTGVAGQLTAQPPTGPLGVAVYFNVLGAVRTTVHLGGSSVSLQVSATVVADAVNFIDARP